MAKSFKRTNTTYHVTAIYLNRETFTLDTVEFDIDSKNQRIINKYVLEHYDGCKNGTDINIADIHGITNTETVTINATLDDIINACVAAGIEITYSNGDDTDSDDSNN